MYGFDLGLTPKLTSLRDGWGWSCPKLTGDRVCCTYIYIYIYIYVALVGVNP